MVDAFDALINGGGGRKVLPPDVALKELESGAGKLFDPACVESVSYTHLRAHATVLDLVCRLLLEKNKKDITICMLFCICCKSYRHER